MDSTVAFWLLILVVVIIIIVAYIISQNGKDCDSESTHNDGAHTSDSDPSTQVETIA